MTISSHTNNQTVNTQTVTLTGEAVGGVASVTVMVGNNTYQANVSNGVWSATVTLQPGANDVWVIAYPSDANCSPVQIDIVIKYNNMGMCHGTVSCT